MNWNELPKEYRDLEKTFGPIPIADTDNILGRFHFDHTPQRREFWSKCHKAKSIDELPKIENVKIFETDIEFEPTCIGLDNTKLEKEQTFEVVSFRSKIVLGVVAKLHPNGFYQKNAFDNSGWTYETLINDENTEIYQVRRNADNTIFTLGEETTNGVIKEFEIFEVLNDCLVLLDNNWFPISYLKKVDANNIKHTKEWMTTSSVNTEEQKEKSEKLKSNFSVQFDKTFFENIVDSYQAKNESIKDCFGNEVKEFPFLPSKEEAKIAKYLDELKNKYSSNNSSEGIKESEGKINVEYDWAFLKGQMNRMSKNKDKYPKNNWKKPMDVEQLKDAMFRHTLEVMDNNFEDDGDAMGHLYAISLNAMMIFTQLNNKNENN
jgi:hypothetical protein